MKADTPHKSSQQQFWRTDRFAILLLCLLLAPLFSCSKGHNMKNDIHQIIEKKRLSIEDVEIIFQVKLHPDEAISTKYVHVYTGQTDPQAVLYDKVEFRKFANNTKFFAMIHMNGKVLLPEKEIEQQLGMQGSFEPANAQRQEKATLSFTKDGKKLVFAYEEDMKQLSFFTIEGALQN